MKSAVVAEIFNAVNELSIKDDFRLLTVDDTEKTYTELLKEFVIGVDRRWWWESFSRPSFSIQFTNDKAYLEIPNIVPDKNETVWFVVEDDQMPYYPIFEATPENIFKVIGECLAFEYYIIPKNKKWLLCENHHGYLIGIGDVIIQKLKKHNKMFNRTAVRPPIRS